MFDIKSTYIILKLLLFAVFFIFGYILSKTKTRKSYWMTALIPIITFAVVEGLRFGRLIDYNLYYFNYVDIGHGTATFYELLFYFICHSLYNLGIPYYIFIFLQCLFLISATFLLFENFKINIRFALPIVLGLYIMNENYIRWYLGFSFILLSLNSIIKDKKVGTWVYAICGVLTHFGFLFYLAILLGKEILNRFTIKPVISIFMVLFSTFLMSVTDMNILVQISNILLKLGIGSLSEGLNVRLTEMGSLIAGNVGSFGIMETSLASNIRNMLVCLPGIYWGYFYMRRFEKGIYIYNLFVIGAILSPIFGQVEMLVRISDSMYMLSCIVLSVVFTERLNLKSLKKSLVIYVICLFSFFASCWPSISIAFSYDNDKDMMFIWDANGRNYLPY